MISMGKLFGNTSLENITFFPCFDEGPGRTPL